MTKNETDAVSTETELREDGPTGDDTTVYDDGDISNPTLAEMEETLALQEEENERVRKEELELEQEQARLEAEEQARIQLAQKSFDEAQGIAFRDTRIIEVFSNRYKPLIESMYPDEPEKVEAMLEGGVSMLVLTGLLSNAGVDLSGREFSTEDVELLAPHVAKRIQHNLNLLRPRGKENARLEYIKEFEALKTTHGFHVRGPNGYIGLTCYEFIRGNEEYITFRINPAVATDYTFMGEAGFDPQAKSGQSALREALVTFSWEELTHGIIKAKKFKLVNGYHPKAKDKGERKSEIEVSRIIREPQKLTHLNDSSDAIFDGITKAARENFNDAVALCKNFGVDPNSIASVMNSNGFVLDQQSNCFVLNQTPTETYNQETEVYQSPPQTAQDQSSMLNSELSSLAQFIDR